MSPIDHIIAYFMTGALTWIMVMPLVLVIKAIVHSALRLNS